MSFLTAYADNLIKYMDSMLGTTKLSSTTQDMKAWMNQVVELTWIRNPQNLYNLIALACALCFVFCGINYMQTHM